MHGATHLPSLRRGSMVLFPCWQAFARRKQIVLEVERCILRQLSRSLLTGQDQLARLRRWWSCGGEICAGACWDEGISPCTTSFRFSAVSIYPHRLLALSQNVRPGEGSWPTGPTTGKLQSLMTIRAEKGTQDLMRWCMVESIFVIWGRLWKGVLCTAKKKVHNTPLLGAESSWVWLSHTFSAWPCESGVAYVNPGTLVPHWKARFTSLSHSPLLTVSHTTKKKKKNPSSDPTLGQQCNR